MKLRFTFEYAYFTEQQAHINVDDAYLTLTRNHDFQFRSFYLTTDIDDQLSLIKDMKRATQNIIKNVYYLKRRNLIKDFFSNKTFDP